MDLLQELSEKIAKLEERVKILEKKEDVTTEWSGDVNSRLDDLEIELYSNVSDLEDKIDELRSNL